MPRIQPSSSISKQVYKGAYKTSAGRIGQQRGVKESPVVKQARRVYVAKKLKHERNVKEAKALISRINAGLVSSVSQIPLHLRTYITVSQSKLTALVKAKEQRARAKAKRRRRRKRARRAKAEAKKHPYSSSITTTRRPTYIRKQTWGN